MSGQGPYFGQAAWFIHYHSEKIPSAIERYRNEAKRVTMVLNNALSGREYLVGDKCTYADLSFIPWFQLLPQLFSEEKVDWAEKYPNYHAWMERMLERPAVGKVLKDKKEASEQK